MNSLINKKELLNNKEWTAIWTQLYKKRGGCKLFSSLQPPLNISISINKVSNQISHYFVRNMLLLTFTASAKAAQHTKTTKPKIIKIFLPFLNKSLLSFCYHLSVFFINQLARYDHFLLLRKVDFLVHYYSLYECCTANSEYKSKYHHNTVPFSFCYPNHFNWCKGNTFCVRTQVLWQLFWLCLIFIDRSQWLVLNLCQLVSRQYILSYK